MTREQRYKPNRRLTRSASDRYIAGVFGGLGRYFKIDPKWLRIGYAVLTILTSIVPGVLIYLLMAIIIPADPQPFNFFDWLSYTKKGEPEPKESRRVLHNVEEHDVKSGRKD